VCVCVNVSERDRETEKVCTCMTVYTESYKQSARTDACVCLHVPLPCFHQTPMQRCIRSAVYCSVLQCIAMCYNVLKCVAVCSSVLQCVADTQKICRGSTHSLVCLIYIYSMTNFDVGLDSHTALRPRTSGHGVTGRFDGTGVPKNMFSSEPLGPVSLPGPLPMLKSGNATRCGNCNTLRHTVILCNTMQQFSTNFSTLQHSALQHHATLQHTAASVSALLVAKCQPSLKSGSTPECI